MVQVAIRFPDDHIQQAIPVNIGKAWCRKITYINHIKTIGDQGERTRKYRVLLVMHEVTVAFPYDKVN